MTKHSNGMPWPLVTEQGHKVTDVARRLGINPNLIHRWKLEFEQEATGHG